NPCTLGHDHTRGLNNHTPRVPRACPPRPSASGKQAARGATILGGTGEGKGVTGCDMDCAALPRTKGTAADLRTLLQVHTACRDAHRAPVPRPQVTAANLRALCQVHTARRQPQVPCTSASQTICGEEGTMCDEDIRCDPQVQTQTSPIQVALVIGEHR